MKSTLSDTYHTVRQAVGRALTPVGNAFFRAHVRTHGISTFTLVRSPVILSLIATGTVALDQLLDHNFHIHLLGGDWTASANHVDYANNNSYRQESDNPVPGGPDCVREYKYSLWYDPDHKIVATARHDHCTTKQHADQQAPGYVAIGALLGAAAAVVGGALFLKSRSK